ncbi:hypothetical protein LTR17_002179 [Elasticomyces elasticus]|nr:hypothetical protein LTR17_002179 [Elasticomyces elasticus]
MASSSDRAVSPAQDATTVLPILQTSKLLSVAPELRNFIYELVFTKPSGPIDLLTATRPPDDLRLVCRQTNHEARGLWLAANREYWPNITFTITKKAVAWNEQYIPLRVRFTAHDLASIRTIRFTCKAVPAIQFTPFFITQQITYKSDSVATFEHRADFAQGEWRMVCLEGNVMKSGLTANMTVGDGSLYFGYRVVGNPETNTHMKIVEVTADELLWLVGRKVVFPGMALNGKMS